MIVTIYFEVDHKKTGFGPKTAFLDPKRTTLGNRGHETASQAAKRPPTGKLKVSRVTSGYRGLMIPLSRVLLGSKNAVFLARNQFFVDSLKKNFTIMTGHLKDNLFVLTSLQGGPRGAVRVHIGPKNLIFYATPI